MRFSFRTKLILLIAMAIATIGLLLTLSHSLGVRDRAQIEVIENRLVPRIELALKLESEFAKLPRAFQDAVQAQELESLERAAEVRRSIDQLLAEAGPALDASAALNLRRSLSDYYESATTVSTLLIRGKSGEPSLEAVAEMQKHQHKAEQQVALLTTVDPAELDRAFNTLQEANRRANHLRTIVGVCGLLVLLLLGYLATRHVLRGLSTVSLGLSKFSTGDFSTTIQVSTNDELGDLARDANRMATSLRLLAERREREDWIRSGRVELAADVSGNIGLEVLADKVAAHLALRTGALAAAVYLVEADSSLRLRGQHGCEVADPSRVDTPQRGPAASTTPAKTVVKAGEGLLGAALTARKVTIHRDLPANYFPIVSGLGQASAQHVAVLPLVSGVEALGVIELAYTAAPPERVEDFLESVKSSLHTTFEAARGRAIVDQLLAETRAQAERLAQQEQELRLNNQELSSQQEELRRANEELEEQQQALGERNHQLDVARKRIEDKVSELSRVSLYKSQFLANMSHELRTPLNSMLLLSHLLARNEANNLNDKQIQHCLTIHSAGEDLLELINQVLDLAKIEAGKQEVYSEEVRVERVAETMRRMFEPLALDKALAFSVDVAETAPDSLITDRPRLERILTNLLSNAIKFTEVGGVSLSIEPAALSAQEDKALAFIVRDTGIGIPATEQQRAFVPFEQLEATSSRRFQGTGLGLAIVRESAHLLGGEVLVHSEPGKGSTFTCVIPVHGRANAAHSADPEQATRATSTEDPAQILIIEDDPILGEQLLDIVRERNLGATLVRTGTEGLESVKRSKPRGIVLDVKLPDTDGWTVMERLQSDAATSDIPVHFLSALDAPASGLMRGAVGYLTKPATREELSELIQKLVPSNPAGRTKILVVEDSLDEGKSIVALLESEHFQAQHVPSAEAALAAIAAEAFGCIILDLGLRTMDGVAFLKALAQRPDFAQFSIIIHTGRSLTREEVHLLQSHSQAIVLKDGSSAKRLLEEVRLFVHHVTDGSSALDSPSPHASRVEPPMIPGLRVLLVDDDMRTVYSISALLQSRGCEVLVAENGREALEVLEHDAAVQCIVTDIMMPEMDGYETMSRVRQVPKWATLPIIALTARATTGERERCLAAGANIYLSKPVDGYQLISSLAGFAGGTHGL